MTAQLLLNTIQPVAKRYVADSKRAEEFARNVSQILLYEVSEREAALSALEAIDHHVTRLYLPLTKLGAANLMDFARDLGRAWASWFAVESRRVGIEAARGSTWKTTGLT